MDHSGESFLNAYLFESLTQMREMAWFWRVDCNAERTHKSLGHLPPAAYRAKLENSSLEMSHQRGSGRKNAVVILV